MVGLTLVFTANLSTTESTNSTTIWNCIELLDPQTRSALSSYEQFFGRLFQLPSEYESASEAEKKKLVNLWIKELQGNDNEKATKVAAYLGIVKAKDAVKPLEKVIAAGRGGGRIRWVCTRSLGQIGEESSIPVLVGLLDNTNRNTRVYARVSLAEITGEYLGNDKEAWKSWQIQKGKDKVVKNPGKERTKAESDRANNNTEAIEKLRRAIDEKYSYQDLRGIDWDNMFDRYSPQMERAGTSQKFAEIAAKMLINAKDMHLWVKIDGKTIGGYKRNIDRNHNTSLLKRTIPGWHQRSERVSTGRFGNGIGYIMINSWSVEKPETLEPAFDALKEFSDCHGLIIDVRPNSGGGEGLAKKIAGCFVDKPIVYAKHVYRNANAPGGWRQIHERILEPNKDRPRYNGKIIVLMGQANMSSCEAFLLMMKQVPNCKLVGDRSYGSSGNPKPVDLGNGVTVWLPSWKALRPDGSCFEGEGIKPDILVRTTEKQLRNSDLVLETALKLLRKP